MRAPRSHQRRPGVGRKEALEDRVDDMGREIARADLDRSARAADVGLLTDAQAQKVPVGAQHRVEQRPAHGRGEHRHGLAVCDRRAHLSPGYYG
jgi:hypothetical protein